MSMASFARGGLFSALAGATMLAATSVSAQEISQGHMQAAYRAVDALRVTEEFDFVLPQAAQALKAQLTQKNPDLVRVISATVDEKALELAARRGDLEREAATIYTRVFTEQQLNEIADFYSTETGNKLLDDGHIVGRELTEAVGIWQRGLARDLAGTVATSLEEQTGDTIQPASVEEILDQ